MSLVAVAVVVLVAGAVLAVRGYGEWRDGNEVDTAADKATAAAGAAAETIFSYRFDQLDDHLSESKALMTKSFQKDFDEIAPALTDLAPQRRIMVTAVTRDMAPVPCADDCSDDEATVLVFLDQARLVDGGDKPTVFGNRITMTMVERDGTWLVDDIRAL